MLLTASSRLLKRLKLSQYFWLYMFYGALAIYIGVCLWIVVRRTTPNLIWILLSGLYETFFGQETAVPRSSANLGQAILDEL